MVTWCFVTNKKYYISTCAWPMTTKLNRVMSFEEGSPPTMVTWNNSHVTNKKRYISICTRLMSTKLDKVMVYNIGPPRTKSHDSWSYVVSWQMKNVIPLISQVLWTANLSGWCLMTWDHRSKNHIILRKTFFCIHIFYSTSAMYL